MQNKLYNLVENNNSPHPSLNILNKKITSNSDATYSYRGSIPTSIVGEKFDIEHVFNLKKKFDSFVVPSNIKRNDPARHSSNK